MSSKNSNKLNIPEAKAAMNKFKMEAASEVGVNLKQGYNGDLTSREAGSVGGQMVKKMIEAQAQQMVEEFAQNIAMQGISFDQYMQFTGSTVEQLLEQVKPQAKARIESSLVLEEVVKAEKIEATEEEFEKELEDMATRYQMEKEKVADLLSDDDKKNLRNDICLKKAAKFVTSKAK